MHCLITSTLDHGDCIVARACQLSLPSHAEHDCDPDQHASDQQSKNEHNNMQPDIQKK